MGRWISAVFAVFCVMAMGVVGYAGQAKPAAKPAAKATVAKPAAGNAAAQKLKNPVPADAASIEAGHAIFMRYCRSCHGDTGKGDGPSAPEGSHPANFTTGKFAHGSTDGEVYTTIRSGVGPKFDMDAWEGRIPDKDIWTVVNYIKSLGPKPAGKP